jgi:hypothetical protein
MQVLLAVNNDHEESIQIVPYLNVFGMCVVWKVSYGEFLLLFGVV